MKKTPTKPSELHTVLGQDRRDREPYYGGFRTVWSGIRLLFLTLFFGTSVSCKASALETRCPLTVCADTAVLDERFGDMVVGVVVVEQERYGGGRQGVDKTLLSWE